MREFAKSHKLDHVCYDIRGPVMDEANMMEAAGEKILKLNIGNPATFGFNAPDDVMQVMSSSLPLAQGYSDSHGIIAAREAIIRYDEYRGIKGVAPPIFTPATAFPSLSPCLCKACSTAAMRCSCPRPTTRFGQLQLPSRAARLYTTSATKAPTGTPT